MNKTVGLLLKWLSQFPEESKMFYECSIYGDDALLIVETPSGEYHNSEEIEGFHRSRECLK